MTSNSLFDPLVCECHQQSSYMVVRWRQQEGVWVHAVLGHWRWQFYLSTEKFLGLQQGLIGYGLLLQVLRGTSKPIRSTFVKYLLELNFRSLSCRPLAMEHSDYFMKDCSALLLSNGVALAVCWMVVARRTYRKKFEKKTARRRWRGAASILARKKSTARLASQPRRTAARIETPATWLRQQLTSSTWLLLSCLQ